MKVRVERAGPLTTIIIDRPEARNAVDPETAAALTDAFLAFEADSGARVAVLTGAGGTFCAGFDLKAVAAVAEVRHDPAGPGPMGPTRLALAKPVIAAVEGHAVAGGLELALWCDLRVAATDAVFGVYCRRWGVPLIDGGTIRLPSLIGQSRALDMILTGRPVGAAEAFSFGLANRLVPAGQARAEAEKLAAAIAAFPPACLRADRASAIAQWDHPAAVALTEEARGGFAPLEQEAREGAARFAGGKGRSGRFDDL